jgi:hypothetical protein
VELDLEGPGVEPLVERLDVLSTEWYAEKAVVGNGKLKLTSPGRHHLFLIEIP